MLSPRRSPNLGKIRWRACLRLIPFPGTGDVLLAPTMISHPLAYVSPTTRHGARAMTDLRGRGNMVRQIGRDAMWMSGGTHLSHRITGTTPEPRRRRGGSNPRGRVGSRVAVGGRSRRIPSTSSPSWLPECRGQHGAKPPLTLDLLQDRSGCRTGGWQGLGRGRSDGRG